MVGDALIQCPGRFQHSLLLSLRWPCTRVPPGDEASIFYHGQWCASTRVNVHATKRETMCPRAFVRAEALFFSHRHAKNMRGRAINARRHTKDTRRRACFANRHTFIAPRHTPFCAPTHIFWRPDHLFTCFVARDAYRLAALTRLTPLFITPSVCLCFGRFRGGRRGRAAQEKRATRTRSEIHVFMGLGRPWASWFGWQPLVRKLRISTGTELSTLTVGCPQRRKSLSPPTHRCWPRPRVAV